MASTTTPTTPLSSHTALVHSSRRGDLLYQVLLLLLLLIFVLTITLLVGSASITIIITFTVGKVGPSYYS